MKALRSFWPKPATMLTTGALAGLLKAQGPEQLIVGVFGQGETRSATFYSPLSHLSTIVPSDDEDERLGPVCQVNGIECVYHISSMYLAYISVWRAVSGQEEPSRKALHLQRPEHLSQRTAPRPPWALGFRSFSEDAGAPGGSR